MVRGSRAAAAREHGEGARALALFHVLAFTCLTALLLLGACREGGSWQLGTAAGDAGQERPLAAVLPAPPRGAGAVHVVRLTARGDRYAFEPSEIRIRPGDVVRFVHTDHQPESVAFDLGRAPEGGAELLRAQGAAGAPLLTDPGAFFDVHFRDAPEGTYPFFSIPHGEFGMRGAVVVARTEAAASP